MSQYAWVLELLPGQEAEYQRRHDEIWPDVVAETRDAGISNYSIFRHGLTLFGYFETDDLAHALDLLTSGEANRRWDEYMAPIMRVDLDETTNFPVLLPLIWRME